MKKTLLRAGTALLLALLAGAGVGAQEVALRGSVKVAGRGSRPPATLVVYAEPLGANAPARPGKARMAQKGKAFAPPVVAVQVGSTIEFPNQDPIYHNVFSRSGRGFDLGLYRAGASKSLVFREEAIYRVFCNIHSQMTGVILVLPTPYFTFADAAGTYRLELPPGRYRVLAWSERSPAASVEVQVGDADAQAPELSLDESQFVELPHNNKWGRPYPKTYDPRGERMR